MHDYDSLVTVENDNVIFKHGTVFWQGIDTGGKIVMDKAKVVDSSFCKGMITYFKDPKMFIDSLRTIDGNNSFPSQTLNPSIILKDSIFENMNYGTEVHGLESRS